MNANVVSNSSDYLMKYFSEYSHINNTNHHDFKGFIERYQFSSDFLKNTRDIDVYLPPSYNKDNAKSFPVVYMNDGNNLFYPEQSFAGVHWAVDSTIENLSHRGLIDEIIVVGIHNTMQRSYEYTWQSMKFRSKSHGGGGTLYARFIIEELKPFIDSKYRTLSDRDNTAIMGSSLGGLISLYLGINHPEAFSKLGVISPSLWWNYGAAIKDSNSLRNDMKIWLDMGVNEGKCNCGKCAPQKEDYHLSNLRTLKHSLYQRGFQEGVNLGYYEDEDGSHNESSWARRLHLPLRFFFGK